MLKDERKVDVTPSSNSLGSGIELMIGPRLRDMFCKNFEESSLDPLGYDVRLGDVVRLITSGEEKTLNQEEEVKVFPGETLIAKTEEILNLPEWAFALGSPKMSLLAKGLWTHGGKTDPGYNHPLTLGFMNVGSEPCSLKRGQCIFHLTFFKINGTAPNKYAGKGINLPSLRKSPLDRQIDLTKEVLEQVKESDGIESYRILKYLYNTQCSSKRMDKIMLGAIFVGNIFTVGFVGLWITGNLPSAYGFIGVLLSQTALSGILFALRGISSLFKKRKEQ